MRVCVCEHTWIPEGNLNCSSSEAVTLFFETVAWNTSEMCYMPASKRRRSASFCPLALGYKLSHHTGSCSVWGLGTELRSSTTSLTTSPDAFLATDLTRSSCNYIKAVLSLM